jgi:hypothetical protein
MGHHICFHDNCQISARLLTIQVYLDLAVGRMPSENASNFGNVWHILWVCRKIGYGQEGMLARTGLRGTEWTLDKRFILSRKRCRFWIAEGLQEGLSKMLCSKLGFLLIRLHSSHWLQIPFLPSYVHISIICEGVGDFIPSVNPYRSSIHL